MSFGGAAQSRFVRVGAGDPCPCGGGEYGGCCGPLLAGEAATTAERLMRSRYTAFVVGDREYLLRSWHPRTRPQDLELDADTRWLGLRVLSVENGLPNDDAGTVEFRARWRVEDTEGALHERSLFSRRAGRWVYVAGEVS